jgi:hypothetical protein
MSANRLLKSISCLSFVIPCLGAEDIFGLRKQIYIPRCAHACRAAIQQSPLECSFKSRTSSQCFASNEPYLQTLAFCMSSQCPNSATPDFENFWSQYVVGWDQSTPAPIYSYETALQRAGKPNALLGYGKPLDQVSLVAPKDYLLADASLAKWNEAETFRNRSA